MDPNHHTRINRLLTNERNGTLTATERQQLDRYRAYWQRVAVLRLRLARTHQQFVRRGGVNAAIIADLFDKERNGILSLAESRQLDRIRVAWRRVAVLRQQLDRYRAGWQRAGAANAAIIEDLLTKERNNNLTLAERHQLDRIRAGWRRVWA